MVSRLFACGFTPLRVRQCSLSYRSRFVYRPGRAGIALKGQGTVRKKTPDDSAPDGAPERAPTARILQAFPTPRTRVEFSGGSSTL